MLTAAIRTRDARRRALLEALRRPATPWLDPDVVLADLEARVADSRRPEDCCGR